MTIDLHVHTTESDGRQSPEELVRLAAARRLTVLGLTDHDTTGGWARAVDALPPGLTLVLGAEFACYIDLEDTGEDGKPKRKTVHMLGFGFDDDDPLLTAMRERVEQSRIVRGQRMVELLQADGHPVSWDRVQELAAGTVGRPHIAAVLAEAGVVASTAEACTKEWIGPGGRYWVGKDQPHAIEALTAIQSAGGVSVLAHPFAAGRGTPLTAGALEKLARAGLAGVEVDHPNHSPAARARLRSLATDLDLLTTGGSDYHGTPEKPQQLGDATTRPADYERLIAAIRAVPPVTAASLAG